MQHRVFRKNKKTRTLNLSEKHLASGPMQSLQGYSINGNRPGNWVPCAVTHGCYRLQFTFFRNFLNVVVDVLFTGLEQLCHQSL